jgi:hypothetical protein
MIIIIQFLTYLHSQLNGQWPIIIIIIIIMMMINRVMRIVKWPYITPIRFCLITNIVNSEYNKMQCRDFPLTRSKTGDYECFASVRYPIVRYVIKSRVAILYWRNYTESVYLHQIDGTLPLLQKGMLRPQSELAGWLYYSLRWLNIQQDRVTLEGCPGR